MPPASPRPVAPAGAGGTRGNAGGTAGRVTLVGRAVVRKARHHGLRLASRRRAARTVATPGVLLNTIPKSGTHLADRLILEHLDVTDSGRFLASTRSISGRRTLPQSMADAIADIRAGELARGHVEFSAEAAHAVGHDLVHVLLVRDPRDVFVSELRYLQSMAPWNHLSRALRSVDTAAQFDSLLHGFSTRRLVVDDCASRLRRYVGWMGSAEGELAVLRYEDLVSDPAAALTEALGPASATSGRPVVPTGSHTLREGRPGAWTRLASPEREAVEAALGPLAREMGYAT